MNLERHLLDGARKDRVPNVLCAREVEDVGRLHVPVEDVLAVQASQSPHHLESHPLDQLWGDVVERVGLDLLLHSQVIGRLHIDT